MSEPAVSADFVAGLSARHDEAAVRLRHVFAERPVGFAPADLIQRIEAAYGGDGLAAGPRHYAPADPAGAKPTAGWDPLDPNGSGASFTDPIEAARVAGYEAGMAAAAAEVARERELIDGVAAALRAGNHADREATAARLRQAVVQLVTRVVGDIEIDGVLLAARIMAATELLADANESAILRVNPADVALLEGRLPDTVFAVGDANVARGSFALEAASTLVEDGPASWIAQLTAALDRVAVPAC